MRTSNSPFNVFFSQLQQDIKAELGEIVGEDTMKAIDEIQANTEMAKDLKDQVGENIKANKDFLDTFQEVRKEMPGEAVAAA